MKNEFEKYAEKRISAMKKTRKMVSDRSKVKSLSEALLILDEEYMHLIKAYELVLSDIRNDKSL